MTRQTIFNLCTWQSTTSGTGAFTVGAAAAADRAGNHYTPANSGAADTGQYHYVAQSPDGTQTENGIGTYSISGGTLARTTVLYNSDGTNTPVNFSVAPIVDMFPPIEPLSRERASCVFQINSGGSITILKGFNIASVVRTGVGLYTVSFINAMPDANYNVVATVKTLSASWNNCWAQVTYVPALPSTTQFCLAALQAAGTLGDPTQISFVVQE